MSKLEPLPNRPENAALNSIIETINAQDDRIAALEGALSTPIPPQGAEPATAPAN